MDGSKRLAVNQFIGAIDQGTTSTRFIVFDRTGQVVALAQKEHAQLYPRPGWVEHDPQEIWRNTEHVIREAMQQKSLKPHDLAAIGITNQRETTIVWERRTGQPLANAIVWQDTRVADLVADLARRAGQDQFRDRTGLPLTTYFSSLKLRWLLDHVAGLRHQAASGDVLFGTVDSFLVWKLTGGAKTGLHITDVTNASRTQLMNLRTLSWDRELLTAFDIPESMLPRIVSSSMLVGQARIKPVQGVPIAGLLGDQQAALVGQTCFQPGDAKNTYGTGCFLLMNIGTVPVMSRHGLLSTVAYQLYQQPAVYALEGSIAMAGALVQWLRDNLRVIEQSTDIEALARTVEDNGGVYFVPAFSGLFAPHWRTDARGVIAGLTRYANKGHLARAALEATAFQTREVVEAMEQDAGLPLTILRVDGGMVENDLLMQFQADLLNRSVVRPAILETTALGAAYAAGLAVGYYSSIEELAENWSIKRTWMPRMDDRVRQSLYRMWKKAVQRSLNWAE